MSRKQNGEPEDEEMFEGFPARLFDGYDGESKGGAEMFAQLLEQAPPELKARIEEFARQRAAAKNRPKQR